MADEPLTDDEKEALRKHRAERAARSGRKVKVRGKHDDSGAEYEFDLDGEEAERVIARHRSLFEDQDDDDGGKPPAKRQPYFKGGKPP
jgi:hypothetical protein